MNRSFPLILIAALFACPFSAPGALNAHRDARPVPVKENGRKPDGLTVAILDIDAKSAANPELGKDIAAILFIKLSNQDGITLVERANMDQLLKEQGLNLTGAVEEGKAIQAGKIVGAKIIVTGRLIVIEGELLLTVKMISTETSRSDGVLIVIDKDSKVIEKTLKLADEFVQRLRERGPWLIAANVEDPFVALKKALSARKLPKIGVSIHERHISPNPRVTFDPAAETEVRKLLSEAGFTIIEGDEKALAAAGVSYVISGGGFSEFATRLNSLINCTAHLEIKITDRNGGVLFTDQDTTRAIDLAENTAGKAALQKAGHSMGLNILRYFDKTLAEEKPAK